MRTIVAAVIEQDRKLLICQRSSGDSSALKWEFPGGKIEPGETPEAALARELREELGVTLRRSREIARVEHSYPHLSEPLEIRFFAAESERGEVAPVGFEKIAWVLPRELSEYDFLAADRPLVAQLATGRIKPAEILAEGAPSA
jgi:8-oxo-dGTP diphosphatase